MLGRKDRWQEELFMVGTLGELVPEDHPLRQIDRAGGMPTLAWAWNHTRYRWAWQQDAHRFWPQSGQVCRQALQTACRQQVANRYSPL